MKYPIVLMIVASVFAIEANATCPELVGKYSYTCKVEKDKDSEFGEILETSGQMSVDQHGCDAYYFTETSRNQSEVIDLNHVDNRHDEWRTKIKASSDKKLKFKNISFADHQGDVVAQIVFGLMLDENYVTKMKIRKTSKGFSLSGIEKSRYWLFLNDRHSTFDCSFDRI